MVNFFSILHFKNLHFSFHKDITRFLKIIFPSLSFLRNKIRRINHYRMTQLMKYKTFLYSLQCRLFAPSPILARTFLKHPIRPGQAITLLIQHSFFLVADWSGRSNMPYQVRHGCWGLKASSLVRFIFSPRLVVGKPACSFLPSWTADSNVCAYVCIRRERRKAMSTWIPLSGFPFLSLLPGPYTSHTATYYFLHRSLRFRILYIYPLLSSSITVLTLGS